MHNDGERRVIYIGAESQSHKGLWGRMSGRESNSRWRRQFAAEMEDACREMTRRGHRLLQVVPVVNTAYETKGWTEGVWLFVEPAERE
jgi:hypothetical protein